MLFYKKLKKDLESIGFKVNPYNPCVVNRMVNGKQHTASHVDPKVNNRFIKWLEQKYAPDPAVGTIKAVRGKIHDYLVMTLDYSVKGQVLDINRAWAYLGA